jgi:hypothetical protein
MMLSSSLLLWLIAESMTTAQTTLGANPFGEEPQGRGRDKPVLDNVLM